MTRRHTSRRRVNDPEALAAQLPDELRSFSPPIDTDDFSGHAHRVAEWLNTQQPGLGYLTGDVMRAAGLTASAWFRMALSLPALGTGSVYTTTDR